MLKVFWQTTISGNQTHLHYKAALKRFRKSLVSLIEFGKQILLLQSRFPIWVNSCYMKNMTLNIGLQNNCNWAGAIEETWRKEKKNDASFLTSQLGYGGQSCRTPTPWEIKHLCNVICASALVLISSSTIVRLKKRKITFCRNIYPCLSGTCISCIATLLDKIPTVDKIISEDI